MGGVVRKREWRDCVKGDDSMTTSVGHPTMDEIPCG